MSLPERLDVIYEKPNAAAKEMMEPDGKDSLSSLAVELQLHIVYNLPLTLLPIICLLNKYWRNIGTDELLRRLLPDAPRALPTYEIFQRSDLMMRAIRHFVITNNSDALQRLLDFRPKHPYFRPTTTSLLQAEPMSLRARVSKGEEERFCLGNYSSISTWAVRAAFGYHDMSCMQLLVDHGLTDFSWLLDWAVKDDFDVGHWLGGWLARPIPAADSRGGHNSVLNWLLSYPPRHVVQAMLVMWGQPRLHPRLRPLCDWCDWDSRDDSQSYDNMLILAASRGHPGSLQTIDELRMMVEILVDDASGSVIPEARQPLSHALRIAQGMASMWPGTPPRIVEYLQSVCTWEDHHCCSSGGRSSNDNSNNPPPPPAPPLLLPPQDSVLHRLIDLKTYDKMQEPENLLELHRADRYAPLPWLVSTEFLADEDAARRMLSFKQSLSELCSSAHAKYTLLHAAGAFRRWRCVEVVLGELRGRWPSDSGSLSSPDRLLRRAILDSVHGEPGCADGRIIRKLLRTGSSTLEDFKEFGVDEDMTNHSPFRGGWVGWESFRQVFVERQQDREKCETPACIAMRDAVLDCLSISDQIALDYLIGEPSKALYRASKQRLIKRLADKWEGGHGTEGESSCGESSCGCASSSSGGSSGGCP